MLQEAARPRAVVVLPPEHVPEPAVQIHEGWRGAEAGQSLCQTAAADQRRAERQLRLWGTLLGVGGHEGQTGPEDTAAGGGGGKKSQRV